MTMDLAAAFGRAFDNYNKALSVAKAVKDLCELMCRVNNVRDVSERDGCTYEVVPGTTDSLTDLSYEGFGFGFIMARKDEEDNKVTSETDLTVFPSGRVLIVHETSKKQEREYDLDLSRPKEELVASVLNMMSDENRDFYTLMEVNKNAVLSSLTRLSDGPAPL